MACGGAFQFYPGESRRLDIRLRKKDSTACLDVYSIPSGATVEVEVPALPNNLIFTGSSTPAVVIDDNRLGLLHVDLSAVQTNQMVSGTVIIRITTAGATRVALAASAIEKLRVPDC